MTEAEANAWVDLIKRVAQEHFKVKIEYRNHGVVHGLKSLANILLDHGTTRACQIVINDVCDHLSFYAHRDYDFKTIFIDIKGSLYDPSFDPAPVFAEIEALLIEIKNAC
jgi:hypothetical protein